MTAPDTAGAASPDLKAELLALIEGIDWTPAEKELARDVARDVARLVLLQLAGQDVAEELALARTAAATIGAAATVSASNLFFHGLERVLTRLLDLWRV